jgi:hypothetical protein
MYIYRVRIQGGGFVDVAFPGNSPGQAKMVAEAQYGAGNVLGYIGESR